MPPTVGNRTRPPRALPPRTCPGRLRRSRRPRRRARSTRRRGPSGAPLPLPAGTRTNGAGCATSRSRPRDPRIRRAKANQVGSLARRPDGRWRARYRDPDGRERAKHFSRKADGERFLAMIESSKLRGTYVDPSDRTTVAEYARRWASARPYRPSTARRIESQIRLHVENTFLGSRRMASVLPSDVQAWATQLAAQLAPSTVELTANMLEAIFAAAVLDRVVGSSPVVRLASPRPTRTGSFPSRSTRCSSRPRPCPHGPEPWC